MGAAARTVRTSRAGSAACVRAMSLSPSRTRWADYRPTISSILQGEWFAQAAYSCHSCVARLGRCRRRWGAEVCPTAPAGNSAPQSSQPRPARRPALSNGMLPRSKGKRSTRQGRPRASPGGRNVWRTWNYSQQWVQRSLLQKGASRSHQYSLLLCSRVPPARSAPAAGTAAVAAAARGCPSGR